MKRACFFAVVGFFAGVAVRADQDVNHFRGFPVPPDEARILALTGVREYACHYEVWPSVKPESRNIPGSQNNYQQDFELFAEVYSGTTCTARYRLATSVNAFDDLAKPLTGLISVGWNEEQHKLTTVIENGQFYSPWHATVHLPDFNAVDAHFFENSTGERRHSTASGDFVVYPVVALCGERRFKIPGGFTGHETARDLLGLYQFVKARNAIIIYLYPARFGEEAPEKYDPIAQ